MIDQYIDNERSKVVNDLEFTGCVEAVQLVPRPWAPQDAYNATGDKLRTDGAIAVLRISDCSHPKTTPAVNAVPPGRFERVTRDTLLTMRNDIWRGNLVIQARRRWVEARRRELLPVRYVHVVFTLPHQFAPLALQNKKVVYDLLFRTSAQTLLEVARDPRHLGAEIGFFSVLHSWNQQLQLNPHS